MEITLVSAGMGTPDGLTAEAAEAFRRADVILGAERLFAALPSGTTAAAVSAAVPAAVAEAVAAHPEWNRVCVALSGDAGFYSAARRLLELLAPRCPEVIPGISAPQYFAARLRRPWQTFRLVSAHGVECDALAEVLNHPEVFFLTGGAVCAHDIVRTLCAAGLGETRVTVGENLSSPEERITAGTAAELAEKTFVSLAVVLAENRKTFTREAVTAGIADEEFVRGGAPMTKREVRAAALALLAPSRRSVLWDVGAGTGSVAVEMALAARRGRVYAVERNDDSCALAEKNRERFGTYNLTVIPGTAPEALAELPPPDAAFIGGSGGSMPDIFAAVLQKNPSARIVASAVTLESLSAAADGMTALGMQDTDVTQIAVTRTAVRGGYRMLNALNPVFLVSGRGTG